MVSVSSGGQVGGGWAMTGRGERARKAIRRGSVRCILCRRDDCDEMGCF